MLKKGKYKILHQVDISNSLFKQSKSEEVLGSNNIFKSVISNENGSKVVYFIDEIDFGSGTELLILNDISIPLIYTTDFKIINKKPYVHDIQLIKKLLNKQNSE